MQHIPLSDPILLPLAPTIRGAIAAHLQSIDRQLDLCLPHHCDNIATKLPPDWYLGWNYYQQSMTLVTTTQYQYVSPIAHQLAAKSLLSPLEICQQLQRSPSNLLDRVASLEIYCWHNEAGYLYFQITPNAIANWLNYIHDLPLNIQVNENRLPGSVDIAIYAHARCCSLLTLAQSDRLVTLTDNWQISSPRWSLATPISHENQPKTAIGNIFEHSAEFRLIHALIAVLDGIYTLSLDKSAGQFVPREVDLPQFSGNKRSPKSPNCSKLAIDLANSWLEFYRHCRIFGDVQRQNPHLAIARCGLTAISRRYLQVLLENYLGVNALVEL
jgi:hypothetical protein